MKVIIDVIMSGMECQTMSVTNVQNVTVLDRLMVNINRLVVDVMSHLKIMVLEDLVQHRDSRGPQRIVMSHLAITDNKDVNKGDHLKDANDEVQLKDVNDYSQGLLETTTNLLNAIIMDYKITTAIIVVVNMNIILVAGLDLIIIIILMETDVAGVTTLTGGTLVLDLILEKDMNAIVD